jgi:glutamine synthetase
VKTTPHALDFYVSQQAEELFSRLGIYTRVELHARHEILLEDYMKKIQIEGRVLGDLAINHIIPTAVAYQNKLITNIKGLRDLGLDEEFSATTLDTIKDISKHISIIKKNVDEMIEKRKVANKIDDTRERAISYCDEVKPYFDVIRYSVDKLELMVDDQDWPLVKYRELLFTH